MMKFLRNAWGHFCTVSKHRWLVFKLCCKAGIPWRGFVHDLSKFSPIEFFESVKFYQGGKRSPINAAREIKGYSMAWLHHKGRNKHHVEYWYDPISIYKYPIIPYKYTIEMICDGLSASMVYHGKEWTPKCEVDYWNNIKDITPANEKIKDLVSEVYDQVYEQGIDKTITKKNLKELYYKHCGNESKE